MNRILLHSASAILLMSMAATFTMVRAQDDLSCEGVSLQSYTIDDSATLYYATVPSTLGFSNGVFCGRIEVSNHDGWVGFGISPDGKMAGSNAIIAIPNEDTVLKYDLFNYELSGVTVMVDEKQTLRDASITQEEGNTIVTFTKLLVEEDEIAINDEGINNFLHARGDVALGYHGTNRFPFELDLGSADVTSQTSSTTTTFTTTSTTTPAPETTTVDTSTTAPPPDCSSITTCTDCLGNEKCGFWSVGECMPDCLVADVPCYTAGDIADDMTPEEVCTKMENDEICSSMNDCTSCVGGIKSDGSTCVWFEEEGFCSSGSYGVTECSAEISSTTEATTTTTAIGTTSTTAPPMDPTTTETTAATDQESTVAPQTTSTEPTIEAPQTTSTEPACFSISTCVDCLNTDSCGHWTINQCMPDCLVADVSCYSEINFADKTPEEICAQADNDEKDSALCSRMNDCTSCVAGVQSDGSTCMWFEEEGFCDTGCNMIGCGVTECSAETMGSTTVATPTPPFTSSTIYSTTTDATTVAEPAEETTTTTVTSGDETTTTTDTTVFVGVDGDFPTESPVGMYGSETLPTYPTPSPTQWWEVAGTDRDNSARIMSCSFAAALALVGMIAVSNFLF